jgi:hypothetical protein
MSYHTAAALLNRGPSRPTLYSMRVPRVSGFTNRYLDFFCEATAIPEVRLDTAMASGHEFMGITREQPTGMIFGKPFDITVVENSNFSVYKDIRNWINLTTQNANQISGIFGGGRNQRMNYYETFASDMELIKLENGETAIPDADAYREVLRVRFINAYPISLGSVQLGSNMTDDYTRFTVSFTYESYSLISGVAGAILGV